MSLCSWVRALTEAKEKAMGHSPIACELDHPSSEWARGWGPYIAGSQSGPSNLQKFRTQHPLTFTRGGDLMVVDHWFIQIEKVLEVMEITSDTTRIRLAVFQLDSEAQIWWKWARTSRDLRGAVIREFAPRD